MTQQLGGQIVLVTGAGQGIGRGIAQSFAARGNKLILVGRTLEKLEATKALIDEGNAGSTLCIACDVKSPESLTQMVAQATAHFGGIDILVNNAQEVPMGTLEQVSDEKFLAGFESGPLATFRLMKLVKPHMVARGGGVIVNLVSSAMKRWDMTGYGAYAAVKHATQSLTRAAAAEWGRDNIRVINIAPHAESPGLKGWAQKNPEEAAAFFRTIPLGRIGTLQGDIGDAVVALCSPEMGYLTGATIPLDGGQANFD
jgi:NAD(P)-dependent dehydrogenase (short-subunit alcohol dehydrogenase family)